MKFFFNLDLQFPMMDTEQVKLNQTRSILSNLICCRQMKMDGQMRVDENRLIKVVSESCSFSTNLNFNYYVLYVIA